MPVACCDCANCSAYFVILLYATIFPPIKIGWVRVAAPTYKFLVSVRNASIILCPALFNAPGIFPIALLKGVRRGSNSGCCIAICCNSCPKCCNSFPTLVPILPMTCFWSLLSKDISFWVRI